EDACFSLGGVVASFPPFCSSIILSSDKQKKAFFEEACHPRGNLAGTDEDA
ncbi:unnamed protein product, partial [Urochloa humidicola]